MGSSVTQSCSSYDSRVKSDKNAETVDIRILATGGLVEIYVIQALLFFLQ